MKKLDFVSSLQIFGKYQNLMYYTHNLIKKFPKNERALLTAEISKTMYSCAIDILSAEKEYSKPMKIKLLNLVDVKLNMLKFYIRTSYKEKYISAQNYETWSGLVTEICNMLGGWIKSCTTNNSNSKNAK